MAISKSEILNSIKRTHELRKALLEQRSRDAAELGAVNDRILNALAKNNFAKLQEEREKAAEMFRDFSPSKINKKERLKLNYVIDKKEFDNTQRKVIAKYGKSIKNSNIVHSATFAFNRKSVGGFGLKLRGSSITGTIKTADVVNRMKSTVAKTFFYAKTLDKQSAGIADDDADKLIDSVINTSEVGVENTSRHDLMAEQPRGNRIDVKDHLAELVKNVSSPECALVFNHTAKDEKEAVDVVNDTVGSFSLAPGNSGPADVTSFHDFYSLKVAFEDIWTEIFDHGIGRKGQELYQEIMGNPLYMELASPPELNGRMTTVDELKTFLDQIRAGAIANAARDLRFKKLKEIKADITAEIWLRIDETSRIEIYRQVLELEALIHKETIEIGLDGMNTFENMLNEALDEGKPEEKNDENGDMNTFRKNKEESDKRVEAAREALLEYVNLIMASLDSSTRQSKIEGLFGDLETRLREKYTFSIFWPNSVNFGLLLNYRQEWKPKHYQVGELVSTIPLAPKESKKYTKKIIEKKTKAQKIDDESLQIRKVDTSETSRVEGEIAEKARNKLKNTLNVKTKVNLLLFNANVDNTLDVENENESAWTKKQFRENVIKSAQEYKNNHKIEINESITNETEGTESHEITNPNDEITVTYLFYELQRVYNIKEGLHQALPVIMIANPVPRPDEIDEEWILGNEWILRKVILDNTFLQTLDSLNENFVSDELMIKELRNNLDRQARIVDEISEQVAIKSKALQKTLQRIDDIMSNRANIISENQSEGLFEGISEGLFGSSDESQEAQEVREEGAREVYGKLELEQSALRERLQQEVTVLERATEKYSEAMKNHFDKRLAVEKLRVHIKENIIYYMQAIWDFELPDQRFLRLHDLEVPDFEPMNQTINVNHTVPVLVNTFAFNLSWVWANGRSSLEWIPVTLPLPPPKLAIKRRKLVQIADLDNLLGYKGNYMIFPLKVPHYVSFYMLQDFVDEFIGGIKDPDQFANYTMDQIIEKIRSLHKEDLFSEEMRAKFKKIIQEKLSQDRKEYDEIIVPSDSLFIEALPGKHPILEDFKLIHRVLDIKKVQAEARKQEIDNLRMAARIMKGDYEDPNIESRKQVFVNGQSQPTSVAVSDT